VSIQLTFLKQKHGEAASTSNGKPMYAIAWPEVPQEAMR
jgi:hypothetical protein